jgi:hypothetical protein
MKVVVKKHLILLFESLAAVEAFVFHYAPTFASLLATTSAKLLP